MKSYKVTITETLQLTVEIEAASREEAERQAEANWKKSDYILDAEHFKGVEFKAKEIKDKSKNEFGR